MSLPAIEVSGLSKRYVIRHESRHDNLRDTLHHTARKLWRRVRWGTGFSTEEFWALRDVSFTVQPGEVVGIIGRNGAGKSTLLKVLSRITEPTIGKVKLRGRVASLLEVGTGFHPELSGRENIFLNGAILGMSRVEIRRKFDEIVAFAEIDRFLDTPVKRYSSGMYVRLAFAVAAHLEPEILIVDEVLAVGDAAFQKKCLGKMQDVAVNGGRTVLFVSHNLPAVLNLCPRALLFDSGQLQSDGATAGVLAHYLSKKMDENVFQPRPDSRLGDGRARIEHFEIRPAIPETGSPLEFIFTVRRSGPAGSHINAELAVSISTEHENPILQIFSPHSGIQFPIKSDTAKITARIDHLPLVSGRYRLNLWLGTGQVAIDWVKDCFLLTVNPGRLGAREVVEARGYPVAVSANWTEDRTAGPIEGGP